MGVEPGESIQAFADEMQLVMSKHDEDKGESWMDCPAKYLLDGLDTEIEELAKARGNLNIANVREELVDIANYCMMLWNRLDDGRGA